MPHFFWLRLLSLSVPAGLDRHRQRRHSPVKPEFRIMVCCPFDCLWSIYTTKSDIVCLLWKAVHWRWWRPSVTCVLSEWDIRRWQSKSRCCVAEWYKWTVKRFGSDQGPLSFLLSPLPALARLRVVFTCLDAYMALIDLLQYCSLLSGTALFRLLVLDPRRNWFAGGGRG